MPIIHNFYIVYVYKLHKSVIYMRVYAASITGFMFTMFYRVLITEANMLIFEIPEAMAPVISFSPPRGLAQGYKVPSVSFLWNVLVLSLHMCISPELSIWHHSGFSAQCYELKLCVGIKHGSFWKSGYLPISVLDISIWEHKKPPYLLVC